MKVLNCEILNTLTNFGMAYKIYKNIQKCKFYNSSLQYPKDVLNFHEINNL